MKLLHRTIAFLVVAAYVGAATVAPLAYAGAPDIGSSGSVMHEQDGKGGTMPCKGMAHGCYSELGCIFLVSLPAAGPTLITTTSWSSVTYALARQSLPGRSIKPALGPPISLV